MIYIYALACPETDDIRYVGKTNHPRFRLISHICNANRQRLDTHCARWIRTLLAKGLRPTIVILAELPDGSDWQAAEAEQIAKYRAMGHDLTNTTNGGNGPGVLPPEAVYNHSEAMKKAFTDPEVRERYRQGMLNAWKDPKTRDRFLTAFNRPEAKKRASDRTKLQHQDPEFSAKNNARLKEMRESSEFKMKVSAGAKAAWAKNGPAMAAKIRASCTTPEHRAKMRVINKEINNRPEVRVMRGEAIKRLNEIRFSDPAKRAAHAAKSKEVGARPEVIAKRSNAMKAIFADPITGAKRRATMATPEVRGKISEATKRTRSTPEERARISERAKEAQGRPEMRASKSAAMKGWWTDPENAGRIKLSMSRHVLTINGRTQSVMDWSKESGTKYTTIMFRTRKGMSPFDAVYTIAGAVQRPRASEERKAKIAAKLRAAWAKKKAL